MAKGDAVFDLEKALFVLQKKDDVTGEWVIQARHVYRGRTDAYTVLEKVRSLEPTQEWRSMLKQEAERYREGWKDSLTYVLSYIETTYGIQITNENDIPSSVVPDSGGGSGNVGGSVPPTSG